MQEHGACHQSQLSGMAGKTLTPPSLCKPRTHTPCPLNMGRCQQHSRTEISQVLSLASDLPGSLQPRPGGTVHVNTKQLQVQCSSLAGAEMGPMLLGGLLLGIGYLSHLPLGHWAPSWAVLVNNQVSLPAEILSFEVSHQVSAGEIFPFQ